MPSRWRVRAASSCRCPGTAQMKRAVRSISSSGARPPRCFAICTACCRPDERREVEPQDPPPVSSARMSFFAVLFALLIEQLKPLPRGNVVHDALKTWMRWAARNFDAGRDRHAWVVWCVTVLVPALAAWGVFVAANHLSVLLALVFNVAVLY